MVKTKKFKKVVKCDSTLNCEMILGGLFISYFLLSTLFSILLREYWFLLTYNVAGLVLFFIILVMIYFSDREVYWVEIK